MWSRWMRAHNGPYTLSVAICSDCGTIADKIVQASRIHFLSSRKTAASRALCDVVHSFAAVTLPRPSDGPFDRLSCRTVLSYDTHLLGLAH